MKVKIVKITAVLIALALFSTYGISLYKSIDANRNLKKLREKESTCLEDLQVLRQEKENYSQLLVQVSTSLYTDQRLFNLYKNFEKEVSGSFQSLVLSPGYVEENGMKWFRMDIQVSNMSPVQFFSIIQKEIPPLYVISFTASRQEIKATVKGMISSPYEEFEITKELFQAGKYTACEFIATTTDQVFADTLSKQGLYVTKREGSYYAGHVIANNLDALTAEVIANEYSQKKIIMFIAKEGGD